MPTPSRYWREIPQRYRFEAGRCKACGFICFPPRLVCPNCGAREFESTKLTETGSLATFTVIRVAPHAFVDQSPYAVGIADLDDGTRLTAQVVDCDFDDLKVGMRVKLEFRKVYEEGASGVIYYGYKFVPE